jgi:transcriptional regulator with XRE-family HTH domain
VSSQISLARRRARARRLRDDEGLSVREIAKRLGVSVSTAHADLQHAAPRLAPVANIQDAQGKPVAGAEEGNTRAMTHGAHSERHIAPLREKHAAELRVSYPRLDDRRLVLLADRLARIEAVSAWLDAQEGIVRDHNGEVYAVVKELERWTSRAEQVLADVEAEHRKARRYEGLEGFLEHDDQEEGQGGGAE